MATTLEEICDIFTSIVQDFRLNALYQSSGSLVFLTYLEPWVLMAIDYFDMANQDLIYDTITQTFSVDLNQQNKNILAQIMTMFWLQKEVQDIQQMRNFIQDKDFKTHSANQAYQAKQSAYNSKREEISQLLNNYGYRNNTWTNWTNQNFS